MTKEQAKQLLVSVIDGLKLTKKEYDTLIGAILVLSQQEQKEDGSK